MLRFAPWQGYIPSRQPKNPSASFKVGDKIRVTFWASTSLFVECVKNSYGKYHHGVEIPVYSGLEEPDSCN
jgi:hypothetical protein